jgi:transcriptional regulator with XRE-family HTH domain
MTQRQVARALGISRTYVQVIERRALAKLAIAIGITPKPIPHWAKQYDRRGSGGHCSTCGERGHNRAGCVA